MWRIILITALLAGCATQAQHKEIMGSWLGQPANSLVDAWGYPHNQFTAPNGNRVLVYMNANQYRVPSITQPGTATVTAYGNQATVQQGPSVTYGGGTATNWCRMFFEVNHTGTITRWRSEGNACKAR